MKDLKKGKNGIGSLRIQTLQIMTFIGNDNLEILSGDLLHQPWNKIIADDIDQRRDSRRGTVDDIDAWQ